MNKHGILAFVMTLAVGLPAAAQDVSYAPNRPPILEDMEKMDVELTYLGKRGGLYGYLSEAPGGEQQVFYITPDGRHLVAGLMFGMSPVDGENINVTGIQIRDMQEGNLPSEPKSFDLLRQHGLTKPDNASSSVEKSASPEPATANPGNTQVKQSESRQPSSGTSSVVSGTDIAEDVQNVAWFSVGLQDRPVIYMVANPLCQSCYEAWAEVAPKVRSGALQARIILVGDSSKERDATRAILSQPKPGQTWINGPQGATPPEQGSSAFKKADRFLQINTAFANKHGINSSPTVFRVANGDLIRFQGDAARLDSFINEAIGK